MASTCINIHILNSESVRITIYFNTLYGVYEKIAKYFMRAHVDVQSHAWLEWESEALKIMPENTY